MRYDVVSGLYGWPKLDAENVPQSTLEELTTLKKEQQAIDKKLKIGKYVFQKIPPFGRAHEGLMSTAQNGNWIIREYEENIKKLKQAENNLATFKNTHKSKQD